MKKACCVLGVCWLLMGVESVQAEPARELDELCQQRAIIPAALQRGERTLKEGQAILAKSGEMVAQCAAWKEQQLLVSEKEHAHCRNVLDLYMRTQERLVFLRRNLAELRALHAEGEYYCAGRTSSNVVEIPPVK